MLHRSIQTSSKRFGKDTDSFQRRFGQDTCHLRTCQRCGSNRQESQHLLHLLGSQRPQKAQKPKVEKDIFGRMFSWMLPSDSTQFALSKMNMLGIGSMMMRYLMKKKGVDSLESLRQQAIDNGVEFIACQMSMDVMGIKREELVENVTVGGVASYMERAEQANVNLFI